MRIKATTTRVTVEVEQISGKISAITHKSDDVSVVVDVINKAINLHNNTLRDTIGENN